MSSDLFEEEKGFVTLTSAPQAAASRPLRGNHYLPQQQIGQTNGRNRFVYPPPAQNQV
jgi:hypothetical protein